MCAPILSRYSVRAYSGEASIASSVSTITSRTGLPKSRFQLASIKYVKQYQFISSESQGLYRAHDVLSGHQRNRIRIVIPRRFKNCCSSNNGRLKSVRFPSPLYRFHGAAALAGLVSRMAEQNLLRRRGKQ